jgi:hypothetical protein
VAKKVRDAIAALRAGKRRVAVDKHVSMSLEFLGVSASEMWEKVDELLEELAEEGPASCYAGGKPPHKSYEEGFKGEDLWAFKWTSQIMGCETYLKFVIKREWFFFFDCHEHQERES